MDLKDKYLDRIADALEEQMGVSPKLIGGNVLKPNIYRIADALDPEPTPLQDGTLKNPLARIAEVIESGGFGGVNIIEGEKAPNSSLGVDYDFYTYKNNLYVKMNGIWKYIGLYNQELLSYIPDGETVPKNYYVLSKQTEYAYFNSYSFINNVNDNEVLILPGVQTTLDFENKEFDVMGTSGFLFGLSRNQQTLGINYTVSTNNNVIKAVKFEIYEHNNYIGQCYGFIITISSRSDQMLTAANSFKCYLIPGDGVDLKEYKFNSNFDLNKIPRIKIKAKDGIDYTIRLVDDTVIQAFHQFVLN